VKQDLEQAANWFRMAADQKYGPSANSLGALLETGRGVERNETVCCFFFISAFFWRASACVAFHTLEG
jgi:TPR repeat protein